MVKPIDEELPYESTGTHKTKHSLTDVFEKDDSTSNLIILLCVYYFKYGDVHLYKSYELYYFRH